MALLGILIGLVWFGVPRPDSNNQALPATVRGEVRDAIGPLAGALVRWKGHAEPTTITDDQGRFVLSRSADSGSTIAAWLDGYIIGSANRTDAETVIELARLPTADHPEYRWVDPHPDVAIEGNCGNCHAEIYREWQTGAHAGTLDNRRFLDFVDGGDPDTVAKKPWNLAAQHPDGIAVCSSCHAPGLEPDHPAYAALRQTRSGDHADVHCDLCHKVRDVARDTIGLAHGRWGLKFLRPAEGQVFFGPLADVDRREDTFSPIERESVFCATCHEGIVFGVHVYSTFSEWQASRAAREGKQCQSCHMAPSGTLTNIAPNSGGIARDPQTLASHELLPGGLQAMLAHAVRVSAAIATTPAGRQLQLKLEADDVGHGVPTGFIDRHMLVLVEARRSDGTPIELIAGARLPSAAGDLAGKHGLLLAKLLSDEHGRAPQPFWQAGVRATDTRLKPDEPQRHAFMLPLAADQVRVSIAYRRFWQAVAQLKGWADDEIAVFDRTWSVSELTASGEL